MKKLLKKCHGKEILLLLAGALFMYVTFFAFQLYPVNLYIRQVGGNGIDVKVTPYKGGSKNNLWWNKDGFTVLEFRDWKNDHPAMKKVFHEEAIEIQTLLNSETVTVIAVNKTTLFIHRRAREGQSLEQLDFEHPIVAVTLDGENFISHREFRGHSALVLLDHDGNELGGFSGLEPFEEFKNFHFIDGGNMVMFVGKNGPTPPQVFAWNLQEHTLHQIIDDEVAMGMEKNSPIYRGDEVITEFLENLQMKLLNSSRYRNSDFGIEFSFPDTWKSYKNNNEPYLGGLLVSQIFVPNLLYPDSVENYDVFSLNIYDTNTAFIYDAPGNFLKKTRKNESWREVQVGGLSATEVSSKTTGEVLHYIVRRDNILYVFQSDNPQLFEEVLLSIRFF